MYTYPLKFEFPLISIGRQMDVTNGDGKFIMRLNDPFISFKDEMTMTDASGKVVYKAQGDDFRLMFRISSIASNWNIVTPDGKMVVYFDDDFVSMEEFQGIEVKSNATVMTADGRPNIGGVFSDLAAGMANTAIGYNTPRRLVYRAMTEEGGKMLAWIVPSRGDAWFSFLPYRTQIQLLNIPLAARLYTPSYEFKLGSLSSPTVLKLQKQRDLLIDKYILESTGPKLTDAQERWAIPALAMAAMFERYRVKRMADW